MKKLVFTSLLAASLVAQDQDPLNLFEDLSDATKISTKTKLNILNSPSVVSVLHADQLKKIGIYTLFDALATVPGIETSMGLGGGKQINMRGNKSIITDKVKFMIDGVSLNAQLSGANFFALNMPIENIDRIEIIRGPASALYGSFAHIGVINVITKQATEHKNTLFVHGSDLGQISGGFTQHFDTQKVALALSGSYTKNQKQRSYTNYNDPALQDKTFNSYENFDDVNLGALLSFDDLSLTTRYIVLGMQNHYGYGAQPIADDPKTITHTSWNSELAYTPQITNALTGDFKLGYKEYSMVGKARLHPLSVFTPFKDAIGDGDYKESTLYTDLSVNYTTQAHDLVFGTYLSRVRVLHSTYYVNGTATVPPTSEDTTIAIPGGGLQDGIQRDHFALYGSDTYTFAPRFSLSAALRYDNYSDAEDALSPRVALLFAKDDTQSYKLMYQNSFRVPTFIELYGTELPFIGDEKLSSEKIDTFEFAYRYQRDYESWIDCNIYYSMLKNFIYRDANYHFKNGNDATSYGVELEGKYPLTPSLTMQANYSYTHMQDDLTHKNVPFIAQHLANLMLYWQISSAWHTGTHIHYTGEKKRQEGDARDPIKATTTFDQTLTYTYKDLHLQLSVKNLFDADVIYPAPKDGYLDDLARDGRSFWLSAELQLK